MSDKPILTGYTIKEGETEHLTEALEIEAEAFNIGDQFGKQTFKRALHRKKSWFVLLTDSQKVAGSCILLKRKNSKKLRLYSIALSKQYQGLGLGALMMDWLLSYAKNHQFIEVTLEVNCSNEAAIRLYKKFGFKQVAILPAYYSDKSDAIKMSRLIN